MKLLTSINRKGDDIERRLFAIKVLGIPLYWWILIGAMIVLISALLEADALSYENQAQFI